ncbi:MAG: rod shape-determining protein MreC [Frankiaceae bacterium]
MQRFRQTRALLAGLVVISFVLVTLDYRSGRGSPLDGVRAAVGSALGPIESGIATGVRPVSRTVSGVFRGADASARAERLAKENTLLRQQLVLAKRPPTADRLSALFGVAGASRLSIVPARVVALGAGLGFTWTVTIDAGSRDGLRPDLAVLTGAGLAGRVKTVTATTATVLLVSDPAAKVGVRVAGSGEIGVLTGRGTEPMMLEMLGANAPIRVGQAVTTVGSPTTQPYPAGVPVGRISRILPTSGVTVRALLTPYVRFSALDLVGVVVGAPRVKARHAVAPAKPAPVVPLPPMSQRSRGQ